MLEIQTSICIYTYITKSQWVPLLSWDNPDFFLTLSANRVSSLQWIMRWLFHSDVGLQWIGHCLLQKPRRRGPLCWWRHWNCGVQRGRCSDWLRVCCDCLCKLRHVWSTSIPENMFVVLQRWRRMWEIDMTQWGRRDVETLSAFCALPEGNPPVSVGFHFQSASDMNFDVFVCVSLNKLFNKQSSYPVIWNHDFYVTSLVDVSEDFRGLIFELGVTHIYVGKLGHNWLR